MDILVPISGGKDSQTCLKLAVQTGKQVLGLFCDTQFEHPKTYSHIDWMEQHYGVKIDRVTAGSVEEKVLKYGRFPGGGARHCTDELKIQISKKYYKQLAEEQGGFEVWLGMRLNESHERKKRYDGKIDSELYPPHEIMRKFPKYLAKLGVMFRLPILEWSSDEVLAFLDGEQNPLYSEGFDRVGCFPCLAGGDKWKAKAFRHDDFGRQQYQKVIMLEQQIGKSVWTSKSGKEMGQGCLICSI